MTTGHQAFGRICAIMLAGVLLAVPVRAQTAPAQPAPTEEAKPSGDASTAQEMRLEARNALVLKGESSWDDGYEKLLAAFKALRAEARRLGLATVGKPQTAFVHTDDQGFRFEAMMVLDKAPDASLKPQKTFAFSLTPAGRAFVFKHAGAYDDIDSTYEAITAWLDEKGLSAKGAFVEEYLTEPEGSDDTLLELNIYVFVE
ncbi:MAG TPA: GyrI-like domain-containing protein [Beijerinckiaceae bacterium]|nr:GyrI-like domain-containing protein [Beijerinckiaceae bacterium]